jgi:hypothetical protein
LGRLGWAVLRIVGIALHRSTFGELLQMLQLCYSVWFGVDKALSRVSVSNKQTPTTATTKGKSCQLSESCYPVMVANLNP